MSVTEPQNPTKDCTATRSVTFCITELDPGGAEKALVQVACGLSKRGWQVSVVSLRDRGELAHELESAHISVTELKCGGLADARAVLRLRKFLTGQRPSLLVCFLHQANIVGRLAGWMTGIPVVSGVRVADRRKLVIWTDRLTRHLTVKYVAVSRHVAEVHSQLCKIPQSQVSLIYNGVDMPSALPPQTDRDDEQIRVLFVGRLTEQKRPQDLIDAVAALSADIRQKVQIDILGDGELQEKLRQQISTLGLDDHVQLHGHQSNAAEWMRRSDALVLPSRWEGLPNVVLEAMANGLPVIASNVDGIPEMIDHGVTGWLVAPCDTDAIAEQLTAVCIDREARDAVANRAFEAVRQRFSWDATIRAFDELLSELLSDGSHLEKNR